MRAMKAWHIRKKEEVQGEIVFARTKSDAINWGEELGWANPLDTVAERVPYADAFRSNPLGLREAQLENGWQLRCSGKGCHQSVAKGEAYSIIIDDVYCKRCAAQDIQKAETERLQRLDEENEADYAIEVARSREEENQAGREHTKKLVDDCRLNFDLFQKERLLRQRYEKALEEITRQFDHTSVNRAKEIANEALGELTPERRKIIQLDEGK